MKKLLLAIPLALALLACTPSPTGVQQFEDGGPLIVKQFDRGGKTITIRVITYDNYKQVTQAKIKHTGQNSPVLTGWAGWSKEEPAQCELHVVRAKRYDDPEFHTWGHELAHCLYGSYHPDMSK